jgi:hypothetical protein
LGVRIGAVALCLATLGLAACGDDDEKSKPAGQAGAPAAKPSTGEAKSASGQTGSVKVSVKPPKTSAADKPTGVAFTFDMKIGTTTGADPSPPTQVFFHAQKGFVINGKDFPQCELADLKAGRAEKCAKARIGGGDAEFIRPGGKHAKAKISTFNGKPEGGDPVFLYSITAPGYKSLAAPGVLKSKPTGDYDRQVTAPVIPGRPPVTHLRLRTVDRTTKAGGKTVHLIEAPTDCAGSWLFQTEATFKSGEKLAVVSPVRCSG